MTRSYDMANRAVSASDTSERIVATTEELLGTVSVGDITLPAIAEGAGVTVQTVLRHMGSRDGCFDAVRERVYARVDAQLGQTSPGDVDAAVSALVAHYESEGRIVLGLLVQESGGEPFVRETVEVGRVYHRAWVEHCFGPLLARPSTKAVDALVAATDLYVWKLLRLDLGRSVRDTQSVITHLVRAILEAS